MTYATCSAAWQTFFFVMAAARSIVSGGASTGPHLDESRPDLAGGLYVQKWGLLGPTSIMHGWLRRTLRMRHETWQL